MNKFDVHDILRALIVVLLSLVAWIGSGIHTEQANISERLRVVELNQVKIMAVLGIEPHVSDPENGPIVSGLSQ